MAQRRKANRAIRRGVAAGDPRVAWLAAAKARWMLQNRQATWLTVFFALLVISWAVVGIGALADEQWVIGLIFVAFFLWGLWLLYDLRPAAFERVRDAERLNRATAQRAGLGLSGATSTPPEYTPLQTAASVVVVWIFYDVTFGALTRGMDGKSLGFDQILLSGAFFATLMVIFNLTLGRARNRRRAERPIT